MIVRSFQGDSEFDASSWIVAIETAIQIGLGDTTVRELFLRELLAVNWDLGFSNKPQNSSHVDRVLKRTFHRTELPGRSATPLSSYSENIRQRQTKLEVQPVIAGGGTLYER